MGFNYGFHSQSPFPSRKPVRSLNRYAYGT